MLPLAQFSSGGTARPECRPKTGHALIAEMKGRAAVHMRSEQMSTAFIRKTQNYPLLHTVFHLRQGKRRLLIRKAALSTIALAGDGVGGHMPTSPSESLHGLTLRGGWVIGNTGSMALRRRMVTNRTKRRPGCASQPPPLQRAGTANGRPSPELAARALGQPSHCCGPPTHTACSPGSRALGPQA